MKHLSKLLVGAALMVSSVSAIAASSMDQPMGAVDVYATNEKLNVPGAGPTGFDQSKLGYGLKGWVAFGMPFVHFEYQAASPKDDATATEAKIKQLRLGGGVTAPIADGVLALGKLEYAKIDLGFTGCSCDLKGPGIHAGAVFMPQPMLHFIATVGYLKLTGDSTSGPGDVKGLEYNIGGGFNFTKELGVFVDYRMFNGKADPNNLSPDTVKVSDIRFGGTVNFGGK